ncbi:MAG: hypothetical protein AB1711_10240 [Thermodesulfobacteriota bacterium]
MERDNGYALMNVEREFLGKNKKRYVLLGMSNLGGGYYSYGYAILNLIPKNNGKSYTFYPLFSVSEDPVDGLCGEKRERFIKENDDAEEITSYKILNEGTEDVTLVFYITEENCKTLTKRTYIKKFKLVNGVFQMID